MENVNNYLFWSDSWYIEDNNAWFVAGEYNAIFKVDLNAEECSLVAKIPGEKVLEFRQNPRCVKYKEYIYCLPDFGEFIWVYSIQDDIFYKIEIENQENVRLGISYLGIYQDKILLFSRGQQKIFELNFYDNKMEIKCDISSECSYPVSWLIKEGDSLYGISNLNRNIYEYNLGEKVSYTHEITNITDKLTSICYDGDKFWMCGFRKEIYVWKKGSEKVDIINEFPSNFGIYYKDSNERVILDCDINKYEVPTFVTAQCIGDSVWFIPFQTNKIIRINKNQIHEVQTFDIESEEIDGNKLWNGYSLHHKYLVEYVKDNRYLELFSLKNDRVLQIDTEEGTYEYLNIHNPDNLFIDERTSDILGEGNKISAIMYGQMLKGKSTNTITEINENTGKNIWKLTSQD